MAIRDAAGGLFRWVGGAVVPMFARPVHPAALAWFVHVVLVAAAAVGLYYAQPHLRITEAINRGPPEFRPFWLAAFFLLVYALAWAVAWLWALLAPGQPTTAYQDIDDAWNEIVATLGKAGIGLADTPIFLVLGEFPAGFESLFRALPNGLVVAGGSAAGSPVRAFANRDGVYLTVPGASLLGIQNWLGESGDEGVMGDSVSQSVGVGASIGLDRSVGISIGGSLVGSVGGSVGAGAPLNEIQRIVRRAKDENRPLTDDEKKRVRDLSAAPPPGKAPPPAAGGGPGPSILQNARLVAEANARLGHVCGLIAAARWPLCPINGAVVAVPASASDRDDGAQQWGLVAREDLARAEAALKMRFPVYALVGGVETLPGGAAFFERFAADRAAQRLGKGFPLNPALQPGAAAGEAEKAAAWVFGSLLPYHVFKQMRAEGGAGEARENGGLFRFLVELRRRAPRLARLVGRAVAIHEDRVPEFGGCYTAVVLPAEPGEAKFAKEFFRKVESSQGYVAWTDAAYDEDAGYRSATRFGYLVLGLVVLGVLALGGFVAYKHFSPPG